MRGSWFERRAIGERARWARCNASLFALRGDAVMTQPWRRQWEPALAMLSALWRCGQAICLPHQVGEGECPAVMWTAGHSGRRSAAVGSVGVLRTERDGERFDGNVAFRFIGVSQAMARTFRSS